MKKRTFNSRKRRRQAAALLLSATLMLSMTGCSEDWKLDDKTMSEISSAIDSAATQVEKTANSIFTPVKSFFESMFAGTPNEAPPSTIPGPTTTSPLFAPMFPPFEGELGVIRAYEERPLEGQSYNYVEVYARSPMEYNAEMKAYYKEYFGYDCTDTMVHMEEMGQFYVDGEDYVPIYRVYFKDPVGPCYEVITEVEMNTMRERISDDGTVRIVRIVEVESWLDGEKDCWTVLSEYVSTTEYLSLRTELAMRMAELTGFSVETIMADTEHFDLMTVSFRDNLRKEDGTRFCALYFAATYFPIPLQ